MANGEDDKFHPQWCQEKHKKLEQERQKMQQDIRDIDDKYDSKFKWIIGLMLTNLVTVSGGLIVSYIKIVSILSHHL